MAAKLGPSSKKGARATFDEPGSVHTSSDAFRAFRASHGSSGQDFYSHFDRIVPGWPQGVRMIPVIEEHLPRRRESPARDDVGSRVLQGRTELRALYRD